jgi:hypothetical protein
MGGVIRMYRIRMEGEEVVVVRMKGRRRRDGSGERRVKGE